MKILVLNYEFPPIGGGGSPVSYEIAKGYVRQGHLVDVVTMKYGDLPSDEVIDGIHVFRVPCLRAKKEICHPWEQLTYLISAWWFLKKRLKTISYEICHAHFILPVGPLARRLRIKYGLPYIMTTHGSDVLGYNKRFAKLYPLLKSPWKKIVRDAVCVTAPSDFLNKKIREITLEGTVITIPNGLDLMKFRPMQKEKKILIVARFFVNKGVHDVLDALKEIDLGEWSVDIVGDGPYKSVLEEKWRDNGLTGKVSFLGWLEHDSDGMKKAYGRASIFVSASYFESFGQTAIEAISGGCYPLLSDIGGYRYIVDEDKYFFRVGDIGGLRDKLRGLISGGPGDFSIDITRFSWDNVITQYLSLLKS